MLPSSLVVCIQVPTAVVDVTVSLILTEVLSTAVCVAIKCQATVFVTESVFSMDGDIGKLSEIAKLKEKYGFPTDKPLVVHVGHASEGRGVEDLALLDGEIFSRLFVDSGIFDNPAQAELLENSGVTIIRGFLEHVEEIYQMADAYLFPTKSGDYVISVPLSVMEALSCGTPAVSYKSMKVSQSINGIVDDALYEIDSEKQLNVALQEIANRKTDHSLISGCTTWNEAADQVEKVLFCKDGR